MTDIENEARRRLKEAVDFKPVGLNFTFTREKTPVVEAMCRLLEEFEAYKREVSDELAKLGCWPDTVDLARFILPKPVDPLVEAAKRAWPNISAFQIEQFREAFEHFGYEIREKAGD